MAGTGAYATLYQLRTRQGLTTSDSTSDDTRYIEKLRDATQLINRYTAREFWPTIATRLFDYEGPIKLGFRGQELLKLTSIVDGQSVTIASNAIIPLGSYSATTGPWYGVELDPVKGFFLYQTTKTRCMSVTGTWGWHDDYDNAWLLSGIKLNAAVSDTTGTALTVTLNDGTTKDAWGRTNPLSPGHLIQIDSEWLYVVDAPTTTSLTVVRGVQGSTAATHSNSANISIYEPPKDISEVCLRMAAYLFAQDSVDFGKARTDALGNKEVAAGWPSDTRQLLETYRKIRVN